jgi:hypothetical protein
MVFPLYSIYAVLVSLARFNANPPSTIFDAILATIRDPLWQFVGVVFGILFFLIQRRDTIKSLSNQRIQNVNTAETALTNHSQDASQSKVVTTQGTRALSPKEIFSAIIFYIIGFFMIVSLLLLVIWSFVEIVLKELGNSPFLFLLVVSTSIFTITIISHNIGKIRKGLANPYYKKKFGNFFILEKVTFSLLLSLGISFLIAAFLYGTTYGFKDWLGAILITLLAIGFPLLSFEGVNAIWDNTLDVEKFMLVIFILIAVITTMSVTYYLVVFYIPVFSLDVIFGIAVFLGVIIFLFFVYMLITHVKREQAVLG